MNCRQFRLNTKSFADSHGIDFSEYFADELIELSALEDAGLVEFNTHEIIVPVKGRLLVRRVAMAFDRHLKESQSLGTYSKVL